MKVSMLTVVCLLVATFAFWVGDAEAQRGRGRMAPARPPGGGGARPGMVTQPAQPKAKAQQKSKEPASKGAQKKQKGSPREKGNAKKDIARKTEAEKKAGKAGDGHEAQTDKAKARESAKEAKSKTPAKAQQVGKAAPGTSPTNGAPAPAGTSAVGGAPAAAGVGPDAAAPGAVASIGPAAGAPVVSDQGSISLLHMAHQKLQNAGQQYGGHKARAMQHIGAALGHLGSSEPQGIPTANGQANMSRPVSDTALREVRTSLQTIGKQLDAGTAAGSGNGHARRAVDDAIREVDAALSVPAGKQ